MKGYYRIIHIIICLLAYTVSLGANNDFCIKNGDGVKVKIPKDCRPVLTTAIEMLHDDLSSVLDAEVGYGTDIDDADIIVDINPTKVVELQGFTMSVNENGQLYIASHDSHGAAYGILELSRMAGVSPWIWWADATPDRIDSLVIPSDYHSAQAPDVEYRGIFINDEDWGLMPWSSQHYDPCGEGVIGPKTTARICELLLRLRANAYWPAMHECSYPFFLTEGNRAVAQKYGIYIGGSHCEPMACSTAGEWPRRGTGDYDYVSNADAVKSFWRSRFDEVADQEIIYTLGMRGVHDSAMQGAKGIDQQREVLQQVIADQRQMLNDAGAGSAPQVFIPYKEVLDVYAAGLDVPEDVTLMWCDDNYGYIRHFPDESEATRAGGNGIYYHISYWGRPHDYLWLGTASPGLLFQQMNEAYDRGIQRMWILNVGDIKPAEYQIELFMDMAWDIKNVRQKGVERHCEDFLSREFGPQLGSCLLPVMREHYRLAFIRKPEFMGNTRTEEKDRAYHGRVKSLAWTDDYIAQRIHEYKCLSDSVESYANAIDVQRRDEYFQLVKYPVQAAAQMNMKMLYGQLARQGKSQWEHSHAAYDSIQSLTEKYNLGYGNDGKWRGMMDCHPRKLPVFTRLDDTVLECDTLRAPNILLKLNGKDGHGYSYCCEWLGHENGAVYVNQGDTLKFSVEAPILAATMLDIRCVPTHSTDGRPLALAVRVDGVEYPPIEYSTYGRSEQWKDNVLNNQAKLLLPLNQGSGSEVHDISISPLSSQIILDQVYIVR